MREEEEKIRETFKGPHSKHGQQWNTSFRHSYSDLSIFQDEFQINKATVSEDHYNSCLIDDSMLLLSAQESIIAFLFC